MSLAFLIALICAGIMGFATTRGGTCMVTAVRQVLYERRFAHLVAQAEASLWVVGGLSLAAFAGLGVPAISSYPLTWAAIAGGALLGFGAVMNRACLFGTVARLGGGEWHYLMTPAGFLVGCMLVPAMIGPAGGPIGQSAMSVMPWWALAGIALIALWRLAGMAGAARQGRFLAHVWHPHQSTLVIGMAFVIMMLVAGSWTYSEALAQIAAGMTGAKVGMTSAVLFAALLGGAILGDARRPRERGWQATGALRCFVGGALMGAGSLLTPGGNDHLLLIGLPFVQSYAWCAVAAMIVTIALSITAEDALAHAFGRRPEAGQAST